MTDSQRQDTLDALLRIACWEVVFGGGRLADIDERIKQLLSLGAQWTYGAVKPDPFRDSEVLDD